MFYLAMSMRDALQRIDWAVMCNIIGSSWVDQLTLRPSVQLAVGVPMVPRDVDVTAGLEGLKIPVLLTLGRHDSMVAPPTRRSSPSPHPANSTPLRRCGRMLWNYSQFEPVVPGTSRKAERAPWKVRAMCVAAQ